MVTALPSGLRQPRLAALALVMVIAALASVVYASGVFAAPASQGAEAGAAVFVKNCQVCHGFMAQGRIGPPLIPLPPEIASAPREALIPQLTGLLRAGIPTDMPQFPAAVLSDSDVASLIDYLLDLNSKATPGRDFLAAFAPVGPVQNTSNRTFFAVTGHTLSNGFKTFWEQNNGLRFLGYPITEEYTGISESDGKPYNMQLFERGRLEYHPEAAGTANDVQLGLVGSEWKDLRTHFILNPPPMPPGGPGGPPAGGPPSQP